MIAPYYLNITFKGIEISAKARMLHADGSKVYEILFPDDERLTLHAVANARGDLVWEDLNGRSSEFYQSLGNAIEQQDELNMDASSH
jgi:hypothetical protein